MQPDTFTITGYNKITDVVTVTFVLTSRTGFTGGTYTGVSIAHPPKDTVVNVKAFFRNYADAFIQGKISEVATQADIAQEIKALLNTATNF